ncbi:MAG: hypothetical protein C0403_00855 [Desulfobacterium sp.]|nr:hypothetical protein [Desulfobacterium sp.]
MKKIWLVIMLFSAMACMGMQGNSASRYPVQKISVTVNVPDSGWRVRILEVHRVNEELWVVSELYRLEGKSSQVVSSIEDLVEIPAPTLPVVHFIIGKTWGWSAKTDSNHYIRSRKEIADKLSKGECIYPKRD